MFDNAITIEKDDLSKLEQVADTGFLLAFGLRFGYPHYLLNRFPKDWVEIYERERLAFGDPVASWVISQTHAIRWSELKAPDPRNVMRRAAQHGLIYGATFVSQYDRRRSFLSVARADREITDHEMQMLDGMLDRWTQAYSATANSLTAEELAALDLISQGAKQSEAAAQLRISLSSLKNRLESAQRKLGARNTINAIAIAVRRELI